MKQDYASLHSKDEKNSFAQQLENIEKETQFNDVLGTATEMVHMLNTRLTEVKSNRNRLGRKLGYQIHQILTKQIQCAETQGNQSRSRSIKKD